MSVARTAEFLPEAFRLRHLWDVPPVITERIELDGRGNRARRTLLVLFGIAAVVVLFIFVGMLPPMTGSLAVALVVAAVFWLIRAQLPSILLVVVTVLLVSV